MTKKSDCDRAIAEALKAFRRIDALVNNAGVTQSVKIVDITPPTGDRIQDVNLRGVLYLSQAVIPQMRAQKIQLHRLHVVGVSAQRGGGILGGPHYSAAKAGVLGLARAMARELGPDGIRVNCVAPGLVQTDIMAGKIPEEKLVQIRADIPLARLGRPGRHRQFFLFRL